MNHEMIRMVTPTLMCTGCGTELDRRAWSELLTSFPTTKHVKGCTEHARRILGRQDNYKPQSDQTCQTEPWVGAPG
jgi:hypothetical protein